MARSFASPPPDTSEGAAAATSPTAQAGSSHPGSGVAEQQAMMHAREVDHVRTVLAAHWQLGMRPPDKLLLAVSPRLAAAAAVVDSQSAGELLHMLHDFEFDPGGFSRSAHCCEISCSALAIDFQSVTAHSGTLEGVAIRGVRLKVELERTLELTPCEVTT